MAREVTRESDRCIRRKEERLGRALDMCRISVTRRSAAWAGILGLVFCTLPERTAWADPAAIVDDALRLLPKPETYRLKNGLTVCIQPLPSQSQVAVVVAYRIGSRDDPPGRPGLAHLVEHMTYRGSRHMEAYDALRLLESEGGTIRGYTMPDRTVYESLVPAAALPRALWVESERMAFTQERFSAASLDAERRLIEGEQKVTESAQRDFDSRVARGLFGEQHPYSPPLDISAFLSEFRLDDVREFYQRGYRPENALLVIAGGIDPGFAREQVERYFGSVRSSGPAPARSVPDVEPRPSHRLRIEHRSGEEMFGARWVIPKPSLRERVEISLLAHMLKKRLDRMVVAANRARSVTVASYSLAPCEVFEIDASLSRDEATGSFEIEVGRQLDLFWDADMDTELAEAKEEADLAAILTLERPSLFAMASAGEIDLLGRPLDVAERVSLVRSITLAEMKALRARLVRPMYAWLQVSSPFAGR
jgi:predicted Zn-dependent peptidase